MIYKITIYLNDGTIDDKCCENARWMIENLYKIENSPFLNGVGFILRNSEIYFSGWTLTLLMTIFQYCEQNTIFNI